MKKKLLYILILLSTTGILNAQTPANDDCTSPITVTVGCASTISASTVNATPFAFPPTCTATDADDDIWYRFTATSSSMSFTISNAVLQSSGNADIGMEIIAGPCVDPTSIFCDNDIVSGTGVATVSGLNSGSSYLVRFWTTGTASEATFDFCISDLIIVPVKLLSLNATCDNNKVDIIWTTANEISNDFFTIERSKDGKKFEILTSLKAATGSNGLKSYSVADLHPYSGRTFYRLKQTDINGSKTYSKTIIAGCNNTDTKLLLAFPNPVYDNLQILTTGYFDKGAIKILGATGTLLKSLEYSVQPGNTVNIDMRDIQPGLYIIDVTGRNGDKQLLKCIKK